MIKRTLLAVMIALVASVPSYAQDKIVKEAIATGERLPAGVIFFTPPLVIRGGQTLRGSLAPGGTTLTPYSTGGNVLVKVDNYGNFQPIQIRDLSIIGSGPGKLEYGLVLNGSRITVENVRVSQTYAGLQVRFSVDNDIRRSMFFSNTFGAILLEWSAITTTRFVSTQFRESGLHGVLMRHGNDVVFDDCIFESNGGWGLVIEGSQVERVITNRFWFENNAGDVFDPLGRVTLGTGRMVQKGTNLLRFYTAGRITLAQY